MNTIFDGTYEYKGWHYHGTLSCCHIAIYQQEEGKTVIVATEIDENQGTSITNCAEKLVTELVAAYDLDPVSLTWIEHYPKQGFVRKQDTYSIVTFTWEDDKKARHPRWTFIPISEYEALISA